MRQRTRKHRYKPVVPGGKLCHPRLGNTRGSCLPTQIRRKLTQKRMGGRPGGVQRGRGTCASNDDECLVKTSDTLSEKEKQTLLNSYFRPEAPKEWKKKPRTWLTNEDIDKVMKQYEEAYPDFHFLSVAPIDFSHPDIYGDKNKCLNQEFCSINIKEEVKRGTRILGAVFNLDHHLKGGSHWVAFAVDIPRKKIYYFDSYGMAPPQQIARLMRSLTLQDPRFRLEQNGRRFQYGNSECGVYSMYFLLRMIEGDDFQSFVRRPIADADIASLRKILFRNA